MSKKTLALAGLLLAAGVAPGCEGGTGGEPAVEGPADLAASPEAPLAAILDALREPDGFARAARLAALLPSLGPAGVPAIREALEDPSIDRGAIETDLLVRAWAIHDPAGAGEWAVASAPLGYKYGVIRVAIELWARVDPEAAARLVRSMGPVRGPNIEAAETALVRGWYDSGKPGLEDFIRDLGLTDEQLRALGILARSIIRRRGTEAAMQWAEALPDTDDRFKLSAFRQLGSELAFADPKAAVAWCDRHCAGPYGDGVRQTVATQWSWYDGRAAMEWLSTAPESKERDLAVRTAFRGWRYQDPKGLAEWMAAMGPEGVPAWLLPALPNHAMWLSHENPLEATRWAARIEDPAQREPTLVAIVRRWREKDPAAAEAWLASSPLSEEAREQARAEPPKPPARGPRAQDETAPAAPPSEAGKPS
jgi:hypothetical protein